MTQFQGKLNVNEIFGSLYNMIISQQVFSPSVSSNDYLLNNFKVDGTLYGDTKLYTSNDALQTRDWLGDAEAQNLLNIDRPEDPMTQSITLDKFRIIPLTVDNYLTKRAWSTEGTFNDFQQTMLNWMQQTKKIYETTLINSYVGTTVSGANRSKVEIDVTSAVGSATGEEKNRLEAQAIAEGLSDLFVDMADVSRDFNDYKFLRTTGKDDLLIVFNSKYANKITKMDLPTIFHKDNLINIENTLPARFFGDTVSTDVTAANNDGTYRSLIECDYAAKTGATNTEIVHVFPGDLIPKGYSKVLDMEVTTKVVGKALVKSKKVTSIYTGLVGGEIYKQNDNIICKIIGKNSVPFMSAFEVSTSFYNNISLTTNHYLIWGYSQPQYLYEKPFITVVKK